ncbi:hypothetical protein [Lolliginicoccus suaedae]|uniref:hypothetical protein n=1 Tax=Lolliginicoccus suaedae TaxID=2605429 RepID=UPI001F406EF6|nr:hypothetical protein [Lolliginicoccus suaedae]
MRVSIGIDSKTGGYYLAIPVSNGLVDYEEYYSIDETRYLEYLHDVSRAAEFAESCRKHELDDLLIVEPGWNRGTPI